MNPPRYWSKLVVVSLLAWLSSQAVWAQGVTDAQKRYKAAVRLMQTGDYERAKTELNTIAQRDGSLAPYAHYYYALAAFRQKNFPQSRLMLKQLLVRYPDWARKDDAHYLLAANAFETGQAKEALEALRSIRDAAIRKDAAKMEQVFLPRITDLKQLKQLNREFPENRNVGLALIDLIQRTSSDKDDLALSDQLTNRFGAPGMASTRPPVTGPATTTQPTATTTTFPTPGRSNRPKGYFNVAVMLPFRLDEFDAGKRARSNQYAYDLYDGMKLAKAKLQDEGITVNLFAYDVDNDANKTLELVSSPAFAQTDLIIGPLYVEPNRIAAAYANQRNMLLLNPIATSSELVADQPMSFLAQPSLAGQARQAAEQAKTFGGSNRRVAIYYGSSRKDSLLAQAYQTELLAQNYQIADFRKLNGSATSIAETMLLPTTTAPSRPTSMSAAAVLHHVFLSSSNDDEGTRLLDALNRRHVTGPLIATASAFDFYQNPVSTFTRRDLYLLYPDFIDNTREPVIVFQEEYLAKRNTIPSIFASEGYDMLLFFGRQLAKNGGALRNRATMQADTDDYLLSGFDYTKGNENQVVPIVKYEDGGFVKINE